MGFDEPSGATHGAPPPLPRAPDAGDIAPGPPAAALPAGQAPYPYAPGPPPFPAPPPLTYAPPLPQARLHPLTLFFAAWNSIRGFLVPALVVLFLRRDTGSLGWIPVAAAIGAAAVGWAVLKYFTFSYWITDGAGPGAGATGGELILRSGVLARTERHIPLARVQDVRLKQGLMHRLLRVVEVQIETAGGQGAEAKLSVLSQAEANRLRDAIFTHRAAVAPAAPAAAEAAAPAGAPAGEMPSAPLAASHAPARHTVRRVTTRELVLAGLTSNQLASGLAVIAGAFALLDDVIDLKTMGPRVVQTERAFQQWLEAGGAVALALVAVGATALLVLVGLVISVMGSVLLFYGFELSLAGEDLHRSYGLFTRHASSLPRRRVQLLRVEEGVLRRMLKLATLRVNSAGSKPAEGETEKGLDVLLPVVPRDEVPGLLPVVFPDLRNGRPEGSPDGQPLAYDAPPQPAWRRVSRRAIWRGTFKGSSAVLLATIAVVYGKGLAGLFLLVGVPVVYALNVLAYRHLGYADEGGFFRARRGWLSRVTHVVPVRNVQAVVIRQNPLDRRHRVATVQVDTAGQAGGAGPTVANVGWDDAVALASALAHQAAAQRYRW